MTDQDYADDNAGRLERIAVALEKLADWHPVLPSGVSGVQEMLDKAADFAVQAEEDMDGTPVLMASAQVRATLALAWAQMAVACYG